MCAGPVLKPRKPSFALPAGAVDCHAHVFAQREIRPTRRPALHAAAGVPADYLNLLDTLGIARAVIVQSGVHGTNNNVIVDAIAQSDDRLKGIALIDEKISDIELDQLAAAGVRGFRSNLVAKTGVQFDAAKKLAQRVKRLGWHVQFLRDVEKFPDLDAMLADFPVEVVIDHMGRPDMRHTVAAPGFQALIRLLQSGRGWSKLSAPYRASAQPFPYDDIIPYAHALVAAAPDQLVWGTDWPHVMLKTAMPNDGDLYDQLHVWVPDVEVRHKILVDNPRRLRF